MKNLTENLIRRYLAALRDHLASRRSSGLRIACALGRGVMAEGQGTLALARMHDWALAELAPSYDFVHASNGLIRRSGNFFAAALEPIEKAHQITRESLAQFRHRTKELRRHTAAMAKHNRELKREITRRKAGEVAVRRGKEHYRLLPQDDSDPGNRADSECVWCHRRPRGSAAHRVLRPHRHRDQR